MDFENENKEQTWLVSSVRTVTSSINKILGKSVRSAIYVSDDGAKDWTKAGCFSHSFDIYEPLYPYFFSVSTNLSSNFFPSDHLTCCTSLNLRACRGVGYIVYWWNIKEIHDHYLIYSSKPTWEHQKRTSWIDIAFMLPSMMIMYKRKITYMLIDKNWILYLWIYSNNSLCIQCNWYVLFEGDNWKLPWKTNDEFICKKL